MWAGPSADALAQEASEEEPVLRVGQGLMGVTQEASEEEPVLRQLGATASASTRASEGQGRASLRLGASASQDEGLGRAKRPAAGPLLKKARRKPTLRSGGGEAEVAKKEDSKFLVLGLGQGLRRRTRLRKGRHASW